MAQSDRLAGLYTSLVDHTCISLVAKCGPLLSPSRPAVKKPNLKLKGRPKLPTGVGVASGEYT